MNKGSHIGLTLFVLGIIGVGLSVLFFLGGIGGQNLGGVLLGVFGGFISTVLFFVGLAVWLGWYEFKQHSDEVSLPIKTKIAIWCIVIIGSLWTVSAFTYLGVIEHGPVLGYDSLILLAVLVIDELYFLSAIFLSMKRAWSWWLAAFLLSALLVFCILNCVSFATILYIFLIPILGCFVSLILIALDIKNYWAMVKYRTAMNKAKSPAD
jgi:hypothetical protein